MLRPNPFLSLELVERIMRSASPSEISFHSVPPSASERPGANIDKVFFDELEPPDVED